MSNSMAENSMDPNSLVGLLKGLCSCMDNKKAQRTGNTGIYNG